MPATKSRPVVRNSTSSTVTSGKTLAPIRTYGNRGAMRMLIEQYNAAIRQSQSSGRPTSFRVDVDPSAAEPILSPIEEISTVEEFPVEEVGELDPRLQAALEAAQKRGRLYAAEILSSDDMLNADAFAELLGTTRATVNTKRQTGQLLGLDGAKRGYRFPTWQLDSDGRPYAELPKLFERLGKSAWAVYRFLMQPHNEFKGRTGLDVLRRGDSAAVLDVAESISRGDFR